MNERPHLRLVGTEQSYSYTYRGGSGGTYARPPRDRVPHAQKLKADLSQTEVEATQRGLDKDDLRPLVFELRPEAKELVPSLERSTSGIQLLNAVILPHGIRATVRVPAQKRRLVEAVLDRYKTKDHPTSGRPRHQDLVENIDVIRLATEADLWTDSLPFPEADEYLWWETWLYALSEPPEVVHQRFLNDAKAVGIIVKPRRIIFPDRVVVLAWGRYRDWRLDPKLFLQVAELRRAKPLNAEYLTAAPHFQAEIVEELAGRVVPPASNAPAVCLLDTGVAQAHPLLALALNEEDAQALDPTWGPHDGHQHGTTMAGVALYGSLVNALESPEPVALAHRLESVKIIPNQGANAPELYGELTQEAVARMESLQPERPRAISLSVTADSRDGGLPSSWSAAVDQMCAGGELTGDAKLVCVSAGNLRDQIFDPNYQYPMIYESICGIEDPGQAWNAVTVGAMTDLVFIDNTEYKDHTPIALLGDLCPTSRTSLAWPEELRDGWAVKPDIVMEGGNWATGPNGERTVPDDLGLLTTTLHPTGRLLTVTHDTSPATASAARLAARIWARYPNLRPETIRGLMVHSARWTDAMEKRFPGSDKAAIQKRLRCYGYGVPSEQRAFHSIENHVTLLYEGELTPYRQEGSKIKTHEMHVHNLPWPTAILQQLGQTPIEMHVTLSYFIEPSPGRRGWNRRHRYASHGLRFDMRRPTESDEQFISRISSSALEEDVSGSSDDVGWAVGPRKRSQGSIHSDWWKGTAAQVAECGKIAVFPVTGWWRERKHLDRWARPARYSLMVTLESDSQDVSLYTAIADETEILQAVPIT